MSNGLNWNTHYQNRLIRLSDIVQSGNVAEFDTFLADFQAKYGAAYNIAEGMATFVTGSDGMSLLQLAALSGEPEMAARVYDIVSAITPFNINYRVPQRESEFFDKTARGIVDKVLRGKDLSDEQRDKYEDIKTLLLSKGASRKGFSRCTVVDGLLTCGLIATSIFRGGKTRRNRRKQRKQRKSRTRRTRH